ncbi:LysR family transcriptional regulator [Nocardia sp. NPDC005825]|uniref:LysR family transcriptional regulator n=1 Tax=unclassified Nocardia TaxID=2637762 RepID=UPI0033DE1022
MDLRLLGYVVAIAEVGSISAAARNLNLTQPTLSRQLRELERQKVDESPRLVTCGTLWGIEPRT